jgi:hypothetical protein
MHLEISMLNNAIHPFRNAHSIHKGAKPETPCNSDEEK